jgi:hypothetical protein
VFQTSDLPLVLSETNRYPFSLDSPGLFGARGDILLRSAGACDRVKDLIRIARGLSTPTHEFIWITGTNDPRLPATSQFNLPECIGDRGYTSVVERQPPYRVATTSVGFLESRKELNILAVLHTLQVKIPVANPDVFGVDVSVQNCLAITLLVFKSPVQPKVLIVPFNPEIDYLYNVIPQFTISRGSDPIQQCSLRAAVTELARVKHADRASFGYSFVEIMGDGNLAVFMRNDILSKSLIPQPDAEAELNVARIFRQLIVSSSHDNLPKPGHSTEELCDYLVYKRVKLLTVSSDSLRCSLPVIEQPPDFYRSKLAKTPDLFWSVVHAPQIRIPAAAQMLSTRTSCDDSICFCIPPYRGSVCEREDSRWRTGMSVIVDDNFVCSDGFAGLFPALNTSLADRLLIAKAAEPCSVWFTPGFP